jgi:membrane protein
MCRELPEHGDNVIQRRSHTPMNLRSIWELLRDTFNKWQQDNALRLAAALTYYAIFSMTPVLIIALAVAGTILGQEAAHGALYLETQEFVGEGAAKVVQGLVENASTPRTTLAATVFGIAALIVASSGLFAELQAALNLIWGIHIDPPKAFLAGALQLLRDRLRDFALVLGTGILLLLTAVLGTAVAALGNVISFFWSSGSNTVLQILTFIITLVIMTMAFAILFKVLPDALVSWGDVWIGAAFTAFLLNVGRLLMVLYLNVAGVGTAFGAAGSFIALLVLVNASAQIFYMGAEFTHVYANKYGSHILAIQQARPVTQAVPEQSH